MVYERGMMYVGRIALCFAVEMNIKTPMPPHIRVGADCFLCIRLLLSSSFPLPLRILCDDCTELTWRQATSSILDV